MRRYQEEHPWRRRLPGHIPDAEVRKLGEQTGLDTLVVLALNDGYLLWGVLNPPVAELTR